MQFSLALLVTRTSVLSKICEGDNYNFFDEHSKRGFGSCDGAT